MNYYDAIAENLESKNQNSKAMVPKEQIFNINVVFESKNVSRCPSVSTVSTVLSSRRNSTVKTENGPTELNFEELISSEDTHIMHFTGFLADVWFALHDETNFVIKTWMIWLNIFKIS